MHNVVYLLGAGFSAPLGLPLMSNFLAKSKDMFSLEPEKYRTFKDIYDTIDEMHKAKSYYNTDLLNIEEILSILEMKKRLGQLEKVIEFSSFIATVIKKSTPRVTAHQGGYPSNYYDVLFGSDSTWNLYGCFLGNLINLELRKYDGSLSAARIDTEKICYSVVTLNYDMVLENAWQYIKKMTERTIVSDYPMKELRISKLHGSADRPDTIISPTWNKMSGNFPDKDWKNAREWLSSADHIRVIGYSLPLADSYIKYLLKAAVLDSFNLKTIDVICLDRKSDAKKRFDDFIKFGSFYRFCDANSLDYLTENYVHHMTNFRNTVSRNNNQVRYEYLENSHERFMQSHAS